VPSVLVKFSGPLTTKTGVQLVRLELTDSEATVAEALVRVCKLHPAIAEIIGEGATGASPHLRLFLNGRGIQFQGGLETALNDGDELLVMLPIGGGSQVSKISSSKRNPREHFRQDANYLSNQNLRGGINACFQR